MNRFRKTEEAVSPVIATILMVAITVVLAGVLVVYLQTLPSGGGSVEDNLGLRVEKTTNNDWLISVTGGAQNAVSVTIQVIDTTTGAIVTTTLGGTPASYNFVISPAANWNAATPCGGFNDNNGDSKINAGDSIILYTLDAGHTNGKDLKGMKCQFLKGASIVGTIKELPS